MVSDGIGATGRGIIVAAGVVLMGACASDDTASVQFVQFDSADVHIVVNEDPATASEAWSLGAEPELVIPPTDDASTYFTSEIIGAIRIDASSEYVIADRMARTILVFDSTGSFVREIGRPGQGPGEFHGVYGLHECDGGRFLVYEGRRASIYDMRGNFLRVTPPEFNDIVSLDGVSDDCSKILFYTQSSELPELREGRVMSFRGTIAWADPETGERTPLLTVPAQDGVGRMMDGELRWVPFPWGKRARWAISGDRVFVATGEEPEVQVWDRERGLTMRIRWGGGRPPVTAEDQRQRERMRSLAIAERPDRAKYMGPDIHVPDFKPTFWEMLVDDRGNLWVQEYPFWFGGWGWGREIRKDAAPVEWRVFNPDGRLLGTVAVPADVDVLAVSGGRMLTLWKDELDLQYVRIYRLMPSNGDG